MSGDPVPDWAPPPPWLGRGAPQRRREPQRADRAAPRREAGSHPDLAGLAVLVVDDDLDAREVLRLMLEHHGARVVAAAGVMEAQRALETLEPAVVLADLRMPHLDGFELIRRLRADPRWARLPVVAVTALGAHSDFLQTMSHGFAAHVTKPVDQETLVAVVKRVAPRPRG